MPNVDLVLLYFVKYLVLNKTYEGVREIIYKYLLFIMHHPLYYFACSVPSFFSKFCCLTIFFLFLFYQEEKEWRPEYRGKKKKEKSRHEMSVCQLPSFHNSHLHFRNKKECKQYGFYNVSIVV
jgi:hypothetical protein